MSKSKKVTSKMTFDVHTGMYMEGPSVIADYDIFVAGWWNNNTPAMPHNWQAKRTVSCCGVLELIDIAEPFWFGQYEQYVRVEDVSKLIRADVGDKNVSWEQTVEAFDNFQNTVSTKFGGIVAYLLPGQVEGTLGRLVRHFDWIELPKLYNPKTKNTLVPYFKVLRTSSADALKEAKSDTLRPVTATPVTPQTVVEALQAMDQTGLDEEPRTLIRARPRGHRVRRPKTLVE